MQSSNQRRRDKFFDLLERGGNGGRKIHGQGAEAADGDGDEVHVREVAEKGGGFEEVFEADVVGGERRRKVAGVPGLDEGDGADGAVVCGGVDEDDVLAVAEVAEQVEAAGAAVHEFGAVGEAAFFEVADGGDADAFVAHQEIADAEDEGAMCCRTNVRIWIALTMNWKSRARV